MNNDIDITIDNLDSYIERLDSIAVEMDTPYNDKKNKTIKYFVDLRDEALSISQAIKIFTTNLAKE